MTGVVVVVAVVTWVDQSLGVVGEQDVLDLKRNWIGE